MFSEGLNLAAITITLYRNIRFVVKNGYNEDALKVFPFLGMVIMASIFVSILLHLARPSTLIDQDLPV